MRYLVTPPRGFKPASRVKRAWFTEEPSFVKGAASKVRGTKKAGINYEKKILAELALKSKWAGMLLRGPWLAFEEEYRKERICQPDGVLVDPWEGKIVIVECKLKHTHGAWFQLHDLYAPVLRKIFPGWEVAGVEVCKNWQPMTPYPERAKVVDTLDGLTGFANVWIKY